MNVQVHVEKKTWNTSIDPIIEVHVILDSGEMSLVLCLFSLVFKRCCNKEFNEDCNSDINRFAFNDFKFILK